MSDATQDLDLDTIDFGDEMINEMAAAQKQLRTDVWFQGLVTEARFEVSKNEAKKGLQWRLRINFLEREGEGDSVHNSLSTMYWVNTPWNALPPAATALEEAERKNKALSKRDMMAQALYALFGDEVCPEIPRRIKGEYVCEDGSKLSKEEFLPRQVDACTAAMKWARQQIQKKSGDAFVHCAPYFRVRYEDDSDFASIAQLANTLPPGAEFCPASQAYTTSAPTVAVVEEPVNGKQKKTKKRKK
jgi:hypothetical protein